MWSRELSAKLEGRCEASAFATAIALLKCISLPPGPADVAAYEYTDCPPSSTIFCVYLCSLDDTHLVLRGTTSDLSRRCRTFHAARDLWSRRPRNTLALTRRSPAEVSFTTWVFD